MIRLRNTKSLIDKLINLTAYRKKLLINFLIGKSDDL